MPERRTAERAVKIPCTISLLFFDGRKRTKEAPNPRSINGISSEIVTRICAKIPYPVTPRDFVRIGRVIKPRKLTIV